MDSSAAGRGLPLSISQMTWLQVIPLLTIVAAMLSVWMVADTARNRMPLSASPQQK